jgi:hypothetical protein
MLFSPGWSVIVLVVVVLVYLLILFGFFGLPPEKLSLEFPEEARPLLPLDSF